ncbi:MAG: (d)CMP kinase [Bacteroidota bacterium]
MQMKENSTNNIVIAVDGFSSTGKSTFAKAIAEKLGILYVDSGAMYRAVTLWTLENQAVKDGLPEEEKIISHLDNLDISFRKKNGNNHLYLNGADREEDIRSMEVSALVSPVSKIPEVREKMVELQREMSKNRPVIMDGRDIGTVVFPRADIKIFMTAKPEIRAERRFKELKEKGKEVDLQAVIRNINERDHIDQTREVSPLKRAEDAVVLDNSHMTPEEQMDWFLTSFKEVLK